MDVAWHLKSTMHLNARKEASSRCVTTRSMMGLLTVRANTSPPRMYVTTPKSTQVVPCEEGMTNSKSPLQRKSRIWMRISSPYTYELRGRIVFTTCVLWILTPPPTGPQTPRSYCKPPRRRRRRNTSTPDLSIVSPSLPSSPQWTALSGSRWRRHLNVLTATSRRSGRHHTHVPVGSRRVWLQ